MIGVIYPDKYAVEETFQLLKIPWEWYDSSEDYDVVIGREENLKSKDVNLIDLSENNIFKKVSDLLNHGIAHNREPLCEIYLDELREKLKQFTTLVEIPPVPWGYSYMVALTHDVDITSVKERSWFSVGYAVYNSLLNLDFVDGIRIFVAKTKTFKKSFIKKLFAKDPWNCFEEWMRIENEMGVKSSFYFIPFKNLAGIDAPKIREAKYDLDERLIERLVNGGWEVGVHGLDNWKRVEKGEEELKQIFKLTNSKVGTRIHWLFFDDETWKRLDDAGYYYDSSFGYNEDVGLRAGTLLVYKPKGVKNLVELPLNIQDGSLFRRKYLNLSEEEAKKRCDEIFDYVKKYGGVVTLLWHQISLASPHNWGDFYRYLVEKGLKEGAWVTRAVDVVDWFRMRRNVRISYIREGNKLDIRIKGLEFREGIPKMRLHVHLDPKRIEEISGKYIEGDGYVDVRCDREEVKVIFYD